MGDPTTDELIAWADGWTKVLDEFTGSRGDCGEWTMQDADVRMFRAIAARLRETAETPNPDGPGP